MTNSITNLEAHFDSSNVYWLDKYIEHIDIDDRGRFHVRWSPKPFYTQSQVRTLLKTRRFGCNYGMSAESLQRELTRKESHMALRTHVTVKGRTFTREDIEAAERYLAKPRMEVMMSGCWLTREEVEEARLALDKPVEPTSLDLLESLQRGDRVTFGGCSPYLVTDPIQGQRRLVADSGIVCTSSFAELAQSFSSRAIIIQRAGRA